MFKHQFESYWQQFSNHLMLADAHSKALLRLLLDAYSEPQRHYHTVQHIVECLAFFHQIKNHLNDPIAVELAIWFHDAIYNPQATDNEEKSAELMEQYCSQLFEKAQLQKVYEWIIATKKHSPAIDQDLNYLLDIDLAILGSSKRRFAEYEQQIQQEYSWVDVDLYRVKRAEVLNYFLEMKPLYQTEYFRDLLGVQAKYNLTSSLKK
ncbi:metal-dependent hydrolase [uncultured Acinetobacter sp.]|uniref:HD domain-containing protein n=1 Tax=uncultured Acinetobacter sp. TaxID=165433 RepID=UPI0025CF45A6|nr:metal-dependent hydrolase [uncultured Acinetobacter sp.]